MRHFDEARWESRRRVLRLMIAERGINGLLEDIGAVCENIADDKHNRDNNYGALWMERAEELRELGKQYNIGRRADRR